MPRDINAAWNGIVSWWSSLPPEDRRNQLEGFKVRFSYNSGKIEDDDITYHDTSEIFDSGKVVGFTGDLRVLFEISNQKDAWVWLEEGGFIERRDWLTVDTVLELHEIITRGTYDEARWAKGERPGSFKIGDYGVGIDGSVGSAPASVPSEVAELCADCCKYLEKELAPNKALTLATFFHAKFVEIHPFADGNGRTARFLSNMLLLSSGNPPITIDEADKLSYYGALDAFHDSGDLAPFITFQKVEAIRTWQSSSALIDIPEVPVPGLNDRADERGATAEELAANAADRRSSVSAKKSV